METSNYMSCKILIVFVVILINSFSAHSQIAQKEFDHNSFQKKITGCGKYSLLKVER